MITRQVSPKLLVVAFLAGCTGAAYATPDTWDSRLTALGVYYTEANVSSGTWYWRLVSGVYEDETESGGTHHIYYKALNSSGNPIENQKTWTAWPTGNPTSSVYQFTKGAVDGYWANYGMAGNWCPFWPEGPRGPYGAWVDGPSDEVWGMGMPCNRHVNYRLTWRWTQKSGGSGTPTIARDPTSLNPSTVQGTSPANQSFTVSNSGTGTLTYSITDNVTWLSVTPSSGTSTGEADTITVQYTAASLGVGTHNATITISDPNATNNPQTVAVTLTVTSGGGGGANLLLNPDFEGGFYNDPDVDHKSGNSWHRFAVSGTSKAGPEYNIYRSSHWSQSIYEANWVAGVYQQVSATAGHIYEGSVYVRGSDANVRFWVGVDPAGGTNPASANIVWSAQSNPGATWTQISAQATASASQVTIFLKAQNPQGYNLYAYLDDASLADQGGTSSPTISRTPATLSPSVQQGGNPANQTFSVSNSGAGTLSYSISDNVSWLSCNPTSGTSTGEADTITVSYTASGLTAGTHNATITISDPAATNNPQTIAVTLTVAPPPAISRSPSTLAPSCTQGTNASNQTFTVSNSGGGTLSYSISDNVSWLSCSPTSGTSTGEQDTITISYTTSGLSTGTHNGTITITDPAASNNPQTIAVTLTVNPSKLTVAEDFNSVPSWTSTFDAGWGGSATWSSVTGGQAGNCLQATRSNTGSSAKVKVYNITANQNYTISIYMRCPSSSSSYWRECYYKLGSNTAQNFDASPGTWTEIKKFSNTGTNGNGDAWVQYTKTFNSGSNTQISVGFKTGNGSGTAPTIKWDTLRIN
ncbi:MAG: hypothetical protein AMXMBFR13_41090 [Phycisphaerae bacterium]